jgi:hypothetical protein
MAVAILLLRLMLVALAGRTASGFSVGVVSRALSPCTSLPSYPYSYPAAALASAVALRTPRPRLRRAPRLRSPRALLLGSATGLQGGSEEAADELEAERTATTEHHFSMLLRAAAMGSASLEQALEEMEERDLLDRRLIARTRREVDMLLATTTSTTTSTTTAQAAAAQAAQGAATQGGATERAATPSAAVERSTVPAAMLPALLAILRRSEASSLAAAGGGREGESGSFYDDDDADDADDDELDESFGTGWQGGSMATSDEMPSNRHLRALLQLRGADERGAYWRDVVRSLGEAARADFENSVVRAYADAGELVKRGAVAVDDGYVRQIKAVREELDANLRL